MEKLLEYLFFLGIIFCIGFMIHSGVTPIHDEENEIEEGINELRK